jgi:methyl-accepting chemotaxis protein
MGGVCTIFIKLASAEDYIRASTNVLDKDGKRAIGTLLKNPGPVYDSVKAGKIYTGEADIVGTMYNTVYEPITVDGKVVGIYLCGFKKE